ncbi:hypothetical protein Gotri_012422 [Gossypium trilobum]|uniref:Uncharacterized protein n=1 Tax=Gossypium trilobum TaxID=34281 RepID=A0A7J9DQ58_9ROSI|nr:hypothetical protein [Gossypium trilobum]
MENLKVQYGRNYYRKFGISPFKQNYGQEIGDAQVIINPIINNIEIPDDNVHKRVNRALKKAGLDVSSSSNLVPTFHVIMANPSQKKSCP